jgi:hypothetical protein
MPYLELGRNNEISRVLPEYEPSWIIDDIPGKVFTADEITPDQGSYSRPIVKEIPDAFTAMQQVDTEPFLPGPIPLIEPAADSQLTFFDPSLSHPPPPAEPLLPNEEIVMVVPTAMKADTKITLGFVLMGAILLSIGLFSTFVYLGYKQYKSMLSTKTNFIYNENPFSSSEKLESNTIIKYKDQVENNFDNLKVEKSEVELREPVRPSNSHTRIREHPNKLGTCYQSPITNDGFITRSFKNIKVQSSLNHIEEFDEPDEVDWSQHHNKSGLLNTSHEKPLEYTKTRRAIKPQFPLKEKKCSTAMTSFIANSEVSRENVKLVGTMHFSSSPKTRSKIRYSYRELIDLEPVHTYQQFEYSYFNDGNVLVTDVIFPSKPLSFLSSKDATEEEFTAIKLSLINRAVDPATKSIELLKLISLSFGLKQYSNPMIYTPAYNILVENIIEFDLLKGISNNLFLRSAFVETIIMYLINCWRFHRFKEDNFVQIFKAWQVEPVVPQKLKIFENAVKMLVQGYRKSLLEEVLTFFSMPPSPHLLQNVLSEALRLKMPLDIRTLLGYLQHNIEKDHYQCCSNIEKLKQWELATGGYECCADENSKPKTRSTTPDSDINIHDADKRVNSEILAVRENYHKLNAKKINKNIQKKEHHNRGNGIASIDDENGVGQELAAKEGRGKEHCFSEINLSPAITLRHPGSPVNLPGSLSPSLFHHGLN